MVRGKSLGQASAMAVANRVGLGQSPSLLIAFAGIWGRPSASRGGDLGQT